ncbi:MAG: acetate--CoA ligase family protein [Promethearchaeota archaeon]
MRDLSWLPGIRRAAVVGASKKRRYFFVRAFALQFRGEIVAVNPSLDPGAPLDGLESVRAYPSVLDVPGEVDYAFVTVPREQVPGVLRQCVKKGVKLVAVFTADFSDSGTEEGRRLERELREILESCDFSTRLLGPNGMGLTYPRVGLCWRPNVPPSEGGKVTAIFQSGGLSNLLIYSAKNAGLPLGKVFSFGNGLDLDLVELLRFSLERDDECAFVAGYVEGIKEGGAGEFLRLLRTRNKPVLLLKGGRTETGRAAAGTHTASIAGDAAAWRAVLRQHNVVTVGDFDALFDAVQFFHCVVDRPDLKDQVPRGVCTISLSGAIGVVATDLFEEAGFDVVQFRPETTRRLERLLATPGASAKNPVDVVTTIYKPLVVKGVVEAVLSDPGVDVVYFELPTWYLDVKHQVWEDSSLMDVLVDALAMGHRFGKVVVASLPHVGYEHLRVKMQRKLLERGVPVYAGTRQVVSVLSLYRDYQEREVGRRRAGNQARSA